MLNFIFYFFEILNLYFFMIGLYKSFLYMSFICCFVFLILFLFKYIIIYFFILIFFILLNFRFFKEFNIVMSGGFEIDFFKYIKIFVLSIFIFFFK